MKNTEQETTAKQVLPDGDLTSLRGRMEKKVGEAQINTIVAYCRKGESITNVERNLKEQGIIENP